MKAASWILGLGVALLLIAAPDASLAQANPPVSQVIYFDVNDDAEGFLALVQKAQGLRNELGAKGRMRVFQATMAGDQTLELAIVVEYANLVEVAQTTAKLGASEKWQALVAEAQEKGYRPVNNSVFAEIGP